MTAPDLQDLQEATTSDIMIDVVDFTKIANQLLRPSSGALVGKTVKAALFASRFVAAEGTDVSCKGNKTRQLNLSGIQRYVAHR